MAELYHLPPLQSPGGRATAQTESEHHAERLELNMQPQIQQHTVISNVGIGVDNDWNEKNLKLMELSWTSTLLDTHVGSG